MADNIQYNNRYIFLDSLYLHVNLKTGVKHTILVPAKLIKALVDKKIKYQNDGIDRIFDLVTTYSPLIEYKDKANFIYTYNGIYIGKNLLKIKLDLQNYVDWYTKLPDIKSGGLMYSVVTEDGHIFTPINIMI